MNIPHYPERAPIVPAMREALHPRLAQLPDGISEYTFAGLYLFRRTYDYHVSCLPSGRLLVFGRKEGASFVMFPEGLPDSDDVLLQLIDEYDFVKGLGTSGVDEAHSRLPRHGHAIVEDRDNFDYLYLRSDLATLAGRRFHKKRNHVNQFIGTYAFTEGPLTEQNVPDALAILEAWHARRPEESDYPAAREALERIGELDLRGWIVYVDGVPAAYAMGESLAAGRSFVVHFEKADETFRGIYQYINQAFAASLPETHELINREQDLGDEGLRQSKMTYRPCGFVKKHRIVSEAVAAQMMGDHGEEVDQAIA